MCYYDTNRRRPAQGASGADDVGAIACAVEVADAVCVYGKEGEVDDSLRFDRQQ